MTTELITITALDRPKEAADQGTLGEIKKQRDLYKTTMYKFAEMLKSLNEKKTTLQGLLVIPLNGVHKDLNGQITREPDHSPIQCRVSAESTDAISLINENEELDGTEQQLTQGLIAKVTRQRDKYREEVYQLKGAIASCQETIADLERHLTVQTHILLTPKKSATESLCGSLVAAVSPNTLEQREQIQTLREEVAKVKEGRIEDRFKDGPIQNYIFLLFIQEKNEKNQPVLLEKFNPTDLSEEDRELLGKMTKKAVEGMDPRSSLTYDLKKLFRTKERNIDGKIKLLKPLRNQSGATDKDIARLEGQARDIFSHFFSLLKLNEQQKSTKDKKNYKDFIFSHDPFLAADLLLAQNIYEECKAHYEKTRDSNDPQLLMIKEKINHIKDVQSLFLTLLGNCQVR